MIADYLLGVATGVIVSGIVNYIKPTHGTIKIDRSNPEKEKYLFEIDKLEVFEKKKRIMLKVDNNADLSQK